MRRRSLLSSLAFSLALWTAAAQQPAVVGLEQLRSYPFPNELAASAAGSRIAWAFNQAGLRNIWVAEGPEFKARRLTSYLADDGQELTSVSISADGRWVLYVRGGDHGSNWDKSVGVNPGVSPIVFKVQIWRVPFAGGEPVLVGDGDGPEISPTSDLVAFERERGIWVAPLDGSSPAKQLFSARGEAGSPKWSPDGKRLAFVSSRGDHAFIGVFSRESQQILWLEPSTSRDFSPRWSPDGKHIAFVRRPGVGGVPESILERHAAPWSIWRADADSGRARRLWKSADALRDSLPMTHGATNLHWAGRQRIVCLSYADGWPHLYSIPEDGGEPLLLTPGNFMTEHIMLSPDGQYLVAAANTGPDEDDIDRRHVLKIPVDKAAPEVVTPGRGLEWFPVVTGDGGNIAFVGATERRPPLPMIIPSTGGAVRTIGEAALPSDFPDAQLVVPEKVVFHAPDGVNIHGQLFERSGGAAKKPAIVYVHGGPQRQMLLGWNYGEYYSNAYALNQFLAARGYVVLAVNYRLGIGYGFDFHRPPNAGSQGASEYQDIKAAGEYLRGLPQVDAKRIGIYGGSYGGYLTALALGRNSDLFAAGVDIHGVHSFVNERARGLLDPTYEKAPDLEKALQMAWASSPIAYVSTWKSPVLLIHGDDDRNVQFSQTVDLVQRLSKAGVPFEELVIPDDTHHFLRHANWLKVDAAIAAFFDLHFQAAESAPAGAAAQDR